MNYNYDETIKKFGENVKKYRQRLGLTQEQLSELCECSAQTISGTETGYSFPSSKVLLSLAEALLVPLMYLFNFGEESVITNKENYVILKELFDNLNNEKKSLAIKILKVMNE